MTRMLLISLGLIFSTHSILNDQFASGGLSDSELATAWGGDTSKTTNTQRCDSKIDTLTGDPIYIGCQAVGGNCTQCAIMGADGMSFTPTQYSYLVPLNPPKSPGSQQDKTKTQNCGNLFQGTCVADTNNESPTPYICSGKLTATPCQQYNPYATEDQPVTQPPPPAPVGGGD